MRRYPTVGGLIDPNAETGVPPGPFNEYSILLNGSNQCVRFFGGTPFEYGLSQPLSFGFWMKCTGGGGNQAILSKFRNGYNNDGYAIIKDAQERVVFQISDNYYPEMRVRTANNQVTLNTWQHWVVTRQGNSNPAGVSIYRNGVSLTLTQVDDEGPTDMNTTSDFCIGSGHQLDYFYSGYLDEVSIWEKELSASEVTELYNSGVPFDLNSHSQAPTYLKGWYRCGDGDSSPYLTDKSDSGYGYIGVMVGSPTPVFSTDVP